MRIGVVGGSGFIGSHVVDKLVESRHDVTVLDIMKPHRGDVGHIYLDITDLAKTCVALAGGYDAVYMLAAMADVNDVLKNPVEACGVNVVAVANVLEAARRCDVGRVILASTVWVYELAIDATVDENSAFDIAKAGHVYTASKVGAELICHAYQKLYGVNQTILRYGIPYGPRARGQTVVAHFVRQALRGEPITIHGDGTQYRSFVYIEDLAEGNVASLRPIAANQTYNLAGSERVTVQEIAETVRGLVGNVEIKHEESRPGDYKGAMVSIAKAKQELDWEPRTSFKEGVARYVVWYRGNLL